MLEIDRFALEFDVERDVARDGRDEAGADGARHRRLPRAGNYWRVA